MAGDVGFNEQVVVLPEGTGNVRAVATKILDDTTGRVSHQYGSRVLITEANTETARIAAEEAPEEAVAGSVIDLPSGVMEGLDDVETMGLEAFALRSSEEYAHTKSERPLAGESWDTAAAKRPDHDHDDDGTTGASAAAMAGGATSARLTHSVAVGIIIVEGPSADLKFSNAERIKVIAEVQNGLSWLGAQSSPQGVRFSYDIHVVTLSTEPGSNDLSFGAKEALWRDPAMASLGYGTGMAGVSDYVQDIRTSKGTKWAYCAFFTKYPVGWFAYASIGGPRLVMDYGNDGWGPDNIDRVFAHETGHIFGAPDEYASSNCNCGGSWGYFNRPNGNCANCASGGGTDCLMKGNTWTMCGWTPWHLGFPQGLRYSGVFEKGSGGYGLWLNASWPYFVKKWQDWGKAGLRLEDIEITRIGNRTLYSGVWRQGSGGYGLWVNATWPSFVQKWQQWSAQGLRLVDFEITRYGSQTRYSGVFRQGSGGYGLWVNSDWTSFREKWQQWSSQGLRLIDLEVGVTGIEAAASPIAAASTGAEGFGISTLDDGPEADADDDIGIGDVYHGTDAGGDDDEAGFGMSTLDGSDTGTDDEDTGFGDIHLGTDADGDDDEAGFGMSTLDGSDAGTDDEDAGFGMSTLDND